MDSLLEVMRLKTIYTKLLFSKSEYILRPIYFVDRKEHAIPLFVNEKTLPVTFLYYEAVCKLMLEVHNDSAPSNIKRLFTRTSNIPIYTTRSSTSQLFRVKHSKLKMQKKAFSRVGVKV